MIPRHLLLKIFGTEIDLETNYAEIIWMIENLYEHFLVSTPFKNPVKLRFLSDEKQTDFHYKNKVNLSHVESTLRAACLSTLWRVVVRRLENHDIFHGASVACGERSILMLGDPESGKTTLTLGLLRDGEREFGFLAEDISVVDLKTGEIMPFPKAFSVTEQTLELFPDLNSIPERIYGIHTMKRIVSISEVINAFSASISEPTALNYILLLKAEEGFKGAAKLEYLSPARAVLEICKHSFSIHSSIVRSIDIARDLVSKAKCYVLKVGELDSTVKKVVRLVAV